MKRFLYTLIAFSLVLGFPLTIGNAQTGTELEQKIENVKRERDALLEEQRKLQAALESLNKEGQSLQGTVKSLDATRQKLANDLKVTEANIKTSSLELQKLGNEISRNESEITNHRNAIKESIRRLYEYDDMSVIANLLAYESLTDVWRDTANLIDTEEALSSAIDGLESAQVKLLQNKTQSEQKKILLVGFSSELKGQKEVVDTTRQVQAKLLAETKQKEAEYQKMLAENQARHEEFERQLTQFENQLKASDQTAVPVAKKGVLSWPLEKVYVTQYFGYTAAARVLYKNTHHNGIDLRAAVGTKVMAARGGVVEGMGNTDDQRGCYSYGRWILIKHDNGLSTIYAHLSAATVVRGQTVTAGQTIGYSGGQPRAYGSGASTGPHLHFGVYASAGVTIAQYLSSQNCKNASIPIANPQDYLDPIAYLPGF